MQHFQLVPGLICEFGVCTGKSTNLIAAAHPDCEVYGFDSFEGFPSDWVVGDAVIPKQMLAVDESKLSLEANIRLVKGFFDRSLPPFLAKHDAPIAFMHIDCDTYESARDVLMHTRARLVEGSVIVFDEILGELGLEHEMLALWGELVVDGFEFEWLGRGGHCWNKEARSDFGRLRTRGVIEDFKFAVRHPRSVLRYMLSGAKVDRALAAAAIRLTRVIS